MRESDYPSRHEYARVDECDPLPIRGATRRAAASRPGEVSRNSTSILRISRMASPRFGKTSRQDGSSGFRARGWPSSRGHGRPQLQWRVDHVERLESASGAADGDVAVVENPAWQCLIDIDAFDLVHVHFDRFPANQASLEDDAAIGDGDFSSPSA